ncbi:MAG: hypothetical protein AMXMBFR77_19170 [Phycisphaerales bacterium]|nr:LON peptidase substrate-binding domain-containing protein [Phycisphaerales bacterium]GIK19458.1 MAG: ATP-dependent protease [Planctomycetota bacterium]
MSDQSAITVNFGRPMPLFPLDAVTLLPQQVLPLHVFEERYRQMVCDALDGPGQFAMAVFEGDRWKQDYHGRPPLKPAVCIGQIVQHVRTPDGHYNLLLQGVCRARIVRELPAREGRLYREAMLAPIGDGGGGECGELEPMRRWLEDALAEGPLAGMAAAEPVLALVRDEDIPTAAVIELVGFTLTSDPAFKYRLLSEGNAVKRAEMLRVELEALCRLIERAGRQRPGDWPKGCSWN